MTDRDTFGWGSTSEFLGGPTSIGSQYADAVVLELLDGGPDRISMRTIGARIGCTASAVHQAANGKAGFIGMVIREFAGRYQNWLRGSCGTDWARLPTTAEDVHGLRVWRTLTDMASGDARSHGDDLARVIAQANASEADLLPWRLGVAPQDLNWAEVPGVLASVRGLREAMVSDVDALELKSAKAALAHLRPQLTKRLVS